MTVAPDAAAAARQAAAWIAALCEAAVRERGRALLAVSGGTTPWRMLSELAALPLRWESIFVAQVDERVAPPDDPRRNLSRIERILVHEGPLPAGQLLAMPVEAPDLESAARSYQSTLESVAGVPVVLDLVQLGLGADGHTASLLPGDPVLEVKDRDVAITAPYQGLRRMTLTVPALARARERLWLVTGAGKSEVLRSLLRGTGDLPALRLPTHRATLYADLEAAGER
jgi:6-phosphogluconolactonase